MHDKINLIQSCLLKQNIETRFLIPFMLRNMEEISAVGRDEKFRELVNLNWKIFTTKQFMVENLIFTITILHILNFVHSRKPFQQNS